MSAQPDRGPEPELRADCARCAGLCCVALAFYASDMFPIDKPAEEPCPHLTPDDRCAIHVDRTERGFGGCAVYDCLGAGQRVTHELFAGRSWRDGPATARAMFDAFMTMRRVHQWLELLRAARGLTLSADQAQTRDALEAGLLPAEGWTEASLARLERSDVEQRIKAYLAGLKQAVPPTRTFADRPEDRPGDRADERHGDLPGRSAVSGDR